MKAIVMQLCYTLEDAAAPRHTEQTSSKGVGPVQYSIAADDTGESARHPHRLAHTVSAASEGGGLQDCAADVLSGAAGL
jgi:hypothetical protein